MELGTKGSVHPSQAGLGRSCHSLVMLNGLKKRFGNRRMLSLIFVLEMM